MNQTTSIFDEIINYLFGSDLYYENLDLGNFPLTPVRLVVLGVFVGGIVACIMMAYNKKTVGNFVRTLISNGCNSPETAKTLEELGYGRNYAIRSAVRGETLRRIVTTAGG